MVFYESGDHDLSYRELIFLSLCYIKDISKLNYIFDLKYTSCNEDTQEVIHKHVIFLSLCYIKDIS